MTSMVREILSASGKLGEKEDTAMKIARLKKEISETKAEMAKDMEAKYTNFVLSFSETSNLVSNLEAANKEVESLRSMIDFDLKSEIEQAKRDTVDLRKQLEELAISVEAANRIKEMRDDLLKINDLLDEHKYSEASKILSSVEERLKSSESEFDGDQKRAWKAAREEFITAASDLHNFLSQQWDDNFRVITEEKNEQDASQNHESKNITIHLGKNSFETPLDRQTEDLSELLECMYKADILNYRASKFAQGLLENALIPIVRSKTNVVVSKRTVNIETFVNEKDNLEQLFPNLNCIFDALEKHLNVSFKASDAGEEANLLNIIGGYCSERFMETLFKEKLAPTIPFARDDLRRYENLKSMAFDFYNLLVKIGFIEQDKENLLKEIENIENTFANNRVAQILGNARERMKEELHHTEVIEETKPFTDEEFIKLAKDHLGKTIEIKHFPEFDDLNLPEGFSFNSNILTYPRCQVSQHVFGVMKIVRDTLEEACDSDLTLAKRLVFAARLVFELYRDVLPTYHRENLEELPLHSALALTNCMYLAFECSTLGYEFKERLPEALNDFLSFAELVLKVRRVGIGIFQDQIRRQRDELSRIIEESGFSQLQEEAQLPPQAQKSLDQVLLQLNRLKTVWQHVLPAHVYSRSIGVLLNNVITELIEKVVKLEDIAADTATSLGTLFSLFEEKAPTLFIVEGDKSTSKYDIVRFVGSWQKFKELILVLGASLKEIDDRWSAGKGPLAVEFTVEEMKQLIRALFQNTDRRAKVLANIKMSK